MAQYTIEDIEILRQKSGVSYEEAVNLLEYHNGSLARALVDMEKNGKLKTDATPRATQSTRSGGSSAASSAVKSGKNIFTAMYRARIKVSKGDVTIINLSVLFMLLMLFFAVWMLIIGGIAALFLGYRFGFERNSKDFDENFDTVIKNATGNAKKTVYSMAFEITGKKPEAAADDEPQPVRTETAASGTTPVNVQFPGEGNVQVKSDEEGFHEADIG